MSAYAFCGASTHRAETRSGGRGQMLMGMVNFSERPHQRSKVIHRSIFLKDALRSLNLVGRTPDQSVMHCCGQRSCMGQPGSTRGQIECHMATRFGLKKPCVEHSTLVESKVKQGSPKVNQRSNCSEIPYNYQIL